MARRRKEDDAERRTDFLGVQLTPTEKAELVRRAESTGLHLSEFARIVLLSDHKAPAPSARSPEAIRELVVALNRIGNNVNQLAAAYNKFHRTKDTPEVSEQPSDRAVRMATELVVEALQKVIAF